MMFQRKLAGLAPERVFYYFEELCKIPHGSRNTRHTAAGTPFSNRTRWVAI